MFMLYDLIYLVFVLAYLPFFLLRKKVHPGFQMRLGILPKKLDYAVPYIWVHSVSVGETASMRQLVEDLRGIFPQKRFLFSTVTPTGNKIAQSIARENDFVTYLPLDLSFIVNHVLEKIKPEMFIIAETEFWPNMIYSLSKRNVPIVVVNGRISDKSFKGYKLIKFLLKSLLNRIDLFCMQTELDANKLLALGVSKDKIRVTGNMKFDFNTSGLENCQNGNSKELLGISSGDKFLVAGSTHNMEERIVMEAFIKLRRVFPGFRLLIAPRHPERTGIVEKVIRDFGFSPVKISSLGDNKNLNFKETVFILDTVGKLLNFYAIADVVFVGGSLIKKGGHNILEPASLGKPVLFGQFMFNFKDIKDLFIENKAGIMVYNSSDLAANITKLVKDTKFSQDLSGRALSLIQQNRGATSRNAQFIKEVSLKTKR